MNDRTAVALPPVFCWTRFGTEAGEQIEQIIHRKELERRQNGGVFYWGIGNSVAPAVPELIDRVTSPEVLFSPIKSRPRPIDVTPSVTVRWTRAETLGGSTYDLPDTVAITSRAGVSGHYALVCAVAKPLSFRDHGTVAFNELENLLSGRPLGASQVTAVVRRQELEAGGLGQAGRYVVALRARLVAPYFVRLRNAVEVVPDAENWAAAA